MADLFSMKNRVVLLTGASRGLGRDMALTLGAAGATVLCAGRTVKELEATARSITRKGGKAHVVPLDITDEAAVREQVAAVIKKHRRIDVLVNNAGIIFRDMIVDTATETFRSAIETDLIGQFVLAREVGRHMLARKYGRIVNIASIAGKEGNPNMTAYSASKAGVIAFTKSLAKEVAQEGICVNSVTPAVVRTKILEQLTEQQVAYMTERIPMRRTGKAEEIAAVVHFLASPDCSFVTGQCYDASGGRATY